MKTQKEIEQLAKAQYSYDYGEDTSITDMRRNGFKDGYNQCQEDMSKISEWQLCPKCFGEGEVSNVGTSSSIYRICPVCNGNKTLVKPII
jgi:DnaJ-class molecular chaperone